MILKLTVSSVCMKREDTWQTWICPETKGWINKDSQERTFRDGYLADIRAEFRVGVQGQNLRSGARNL